MDVTLIRSAPLYAGTSLTLTCTVTLDPNVNNNESVMTEWSGPQSIPGDRYSVTPAMRESDSNYTGSLNISPLADTCQAEISIPSVIVMMTRRGSSGVTVQSKCPPSKALSAISDVCISPQFQCQW